ncbi:MAG: adenosylhomocysteinase, partial [Actinobacteria bacterium]
MSFSAQALAAEWLIDNQALLESKVYVLPTELDNEVARLRLEAMSGSLEKLTPTQEQYLASWEHGT